MATVPRAAQSHMGCHERPWTRIPRDLEAFAERFKRRGPDQTPGLHPGGPPILQAWLEEGEKSHREKLNKPELFNGAEKKRKRTSIAAPEKRSLEAYFAIQPRPSSEKIAAIAEKLDLKKNVVRVWFCNQRQKQKRMKYSACV
ncbi:hypothetical protein CRUP_036483 [Coryphaenoides rupestris]|nr:hypothetical protein CRUP_036483 [Coryphaenoides rupestris]